MLSLIARIVLKISPTNFILCYHRVVPEEIAKAELLHRALYVTPRTFEGHLKWMLRHGKIVGIEEILENSRESKFMITFDDGWKDVYTYAFPILKKYGVPATIFIATDNVDKGKVFWSEDICIKLGEVLKNRSCNEIVCILRKKIESVLATFSVDLSLDGTSYDLDYLVDRIIECLKQIDLPERERIIYSLYSELGVGYCNSNYKLLLTWEDISVMAEAGISFGSHTHTHALLNRVKCELIDQELVMSKILLNKKIKRKIDSFSYPNGYWTPQIKYFLQKNGYKYAYTLENKPLSAHSKDLLLLPRCLLYESISRSMDTWLLKLLAKIFIGPPYRFSRKIRSNR